MSDGMVQDGECVMLDLRSGRTVWELDPLPDLPTAALPRSCRADVVIVGGGITGAFIAERLTREGREVLIIDRHEPGTASTAASTSLLQWEIDAPMLELEAELGFDKAAAIYRRSHAMVGEIAASVVRVAASGTSRVRFIPRDTLYFAGRLLGPAELTEEHRLRAMAGLPGDVLDRDRLLTAYGFDRAAAIRSPDSAEANPVALAHAMMAAALGRGARIVSPAVATDYSFGFQSAHVRLDSGVQIEASLVVLANGYEMPPFVPATAHRVASTWALATKPQPPAALWPSRALLWEASEPYLYARTTADGRIIIGGEDEDITDAAARDARMPAKTARLLEALTDWVPQAEPEVDAAWSGFFGETEDGLPLIGPVPGQPRCFAAFGYGGNGITFSALATDLIATAASGGHDPLTEVFAIDR